MGFPAKMLNPGEQVAVDVRPHWKYLFVPALATAVALAGSIAVLVAGAVSTGVNVPKWAEIALGAVLVLCLIWLFGRYLRWTTTTLVVTNERLVMRKGVLHRSGREILLDRLTDISYNQTIMDRILGCGDILLESPGRDSPEVFPDLPHPISIQNEIYRLINARRGGPGLGGAGDLSAGGPGYGASTAPVASPTEPPAGAPGGGTWPDTAPEGGAGGLSVAEQLSQLDDLRRRKVISKREFEAKKAELLSRM